MSSTAKQHSTSDQKAYLIRNLNKIENPMEFFELINKTRSVVTCTSDGLTINDKIDISPEAFNEIGKAVFQDKVEQITRYQKPALHKSLLKNFGAGVPPERREAFVERLDAITNLPANERKEAMRVFVQEFKGEASGMGQAFDATWNAAETDCNDDIKRQIKEMVKNLKQGSNETEQITDFDKLKDLATKQINGTIKPEEKQELQQKIDKCSRHRKQHFFQISAGHRTDANYDKTMDTLEKKAAGGKNLEEWKMTQHDLEDARQKNSISDAEYQQQKREINKGIMQAEYVRDFRSKADDFVNSKIESANGSNLKQAFIDDCITAVGEANQTRNAIAIANANEKLRIAQKIDKELNANTLDINKSFKSDIKTFTNAQNERLCYRIDVDQVKSNLQHIYERPNVEDITVNGKTIFANMKIAEYDRLHRVLQDYEPNGNTLMTAATNIADDPAFVGQVNTVYDITSITEAINTNTDAKIEPFENRLEAIKNLPANERKEAMRILAQEFKDDASGIGQALNVLWNNDLNSNKDLKKIVGKLRQAHLNSLASGTGTDYDTFRSTFNEKIGEVNALDPSIRSQWPSPLWMAYHGWKHNRFGNKTITMAEYFGEYANNLFTTENMTVKAHTQSGNVRQTYMRSFGERIHVGFTVGPGSKKDSHFEKLATR